MDRLVKFSKDGTNSYCFVQVKNELFPTVPKSTVKSWLRELNIMCKRCGDDERHHFKSALPDLNGAFGMIDQSDLNKLLDYYSHKKATPVNSLQVNSDSATSTISNMDIACGLDYVTDMVEINSSCTSLVENSCETDEKAGNKSLASISFSACSTVNQIDLTSSEHYTNDYCYTDSTSDATLATTTTPPLTTALTTREVGVESRGGPIHRRRYTLREEEMSDNLKIDLKQFNEFYRSVTNPHRNSFSVSETTMSKVNERVLCFLGFVKTYCPGGHIPTLSLTSNLEIIGQYVHYLTDVRKLMASTVQRNISALLNVIKYKHQHITDIEKLAEVVAIRNISRQLAREEEFTRKRKREGFSSEKSKTLFFSHILDVIRQLRDQYYNNTGIRSARFLHDFVMLSLYIRALPGRCKEIRTLKLIDHIGGQTNFPTENVAALNAIVFEPDGSISLIETDFKTVKSMGPSKIDLSDDEWLVYFIRLYVERHRMSLFLGKSHDFFFMNNNGDPFMSSGGISKYLGDLFDREVSIRASTTKMRHAIVTNFMSLPESENQNLRESLASLLKHSVRHQQLTYNDQKRQEKVELGRSFMRKRLLESDPFGVEESEISFVKDSNARENPDDSLKEDILPQVGELCALLDPASTGPDNAFIFIAKVLRYTPDKKKVCLQELEELPDTTDLYRTKCSSTWWERVETLVYPIDISYVSSEKAYQLRTTARQIYNDITTHN